MHIFKMFLAGTFLAAGVIGAFAPWLSSHVYAVFQSAAVAAKAETAIEVVLPLLIGAGTGMFAARRSPSSSGV